MLDITVRTENWQHHVRVSEETLRDLALRIGGDGDRFLVVQRIPDIPDEFIQVWHEDGGGYQLEHRAGGPERHYVVEGGDAERVAAVIVRWARRETAWDHGLGWALADLPLPEPVPEIDEEIRGVLEDRVRELLRCGYDDRERLSEAAEHHLVEGEVRPVTRAQASALVDRLWLERVEEMAGWAGTTDPERVTAAFETLEGAGITARENFTCCRNCGTTEIGGEGEEDARGFVFFHAQCTEGAANGGPLYLLYGGFDGVAETTTAVGREVTDALRGQGLTVEWDGSPESSILVTGLDWRKRLTG
ncbi:MULTISPECIES: DUF6891 domain-containing protein [Streptomyces]|uniref:DUF6891 domain-containing protein n=1 Tax=Streptomyces solicathayae TaxID=3081768 RepID=A0ABZ0LZ11_9ACTN|nr:hypothetical protein [Streptomyces sp. HUAS YS2]WOX24760.1 hypothetical protein R2D22_26625 [Streptomyces sp. HUAS YS2]